RSKLKDAAVNRGSSFAATTHRCRKAIRISLCVRQTCFSKQPRSTTVFHSGSKRRFHTARDWAGEVATPLRHCWGSTNCSTRNYLVKRWRKWRRRSDRTFHFSFFNPQRPAKDAASWSIRLSSAKNCRSCFLNLSSACLQSGHTRAGETRAKFWESRTLPKNSL